MHVKPALSIAGTHLWPLLAGGRRNKPLRQITSDLRSLHTLYGVVPLHYIRLALYRAETPDVRHFLPSSLADRRRRPLQDQDAQRILGDKERFHATMSAANVPLPQLALAVTGDNCVTADSTVLSIAEAAVHLHAQPFDLISKPANGAGGAGVSLVTDIDASLHTAQHAGGTILFEERLRPHPAMAPLFCGAINTIRIDTTLQDGVWRHSGAAIRLGAQNEVVDNGPAGGLVAGVNVRTGRLTGTLHNLNKGRISIGDRHPVTGTPLRDFQLPDWDAMCATACAAAETVKGAVTIGWDMALTDRGPVIIEGNAGWNINMLQLCGDGLLDQPIGRLLFAQVHQAVHTQTLPKGVSA